VQELPAVPSRLLGLAHPVTAEDAWRTWWRDYPGDVRKITPPPGACPYRIHSDGDPSSPCILPAGHPGDCEDVEGYTENNG
jgi:hypothetical protein